MSSTAYKAYLLVIGLLVAWTTCGVALACLIFPGALDASDQPAPRNVTISHGDAR